VPLILALLIDWIVDPLVKWPLVRLFHAIRELWVSMRTTGWYVTRGKVVALHAKQERPFWHVQLTFRYSAESHSYLAVWRRVFVFEREVDRFMDNHPAGSRITVRYCPGKINQPVIVDADQPQPMRQEQPSTGPTEDFRSPDHPITRSPDSP
jgi:hypothetical protein